MIFGNPSTSSAQESPKQGSPAQNSVWDKLGRVLCVVLLAFGLGGCLEYDVGIQFNSQTAGAIVQHIHLDTTSPLSSLTLEQWLETLADRTQTLQGRSRRISPQDVELTLPFANGTDLVKKFNTLFSADQEMALFPMTAHVALNQQNALLAIRNQLHLDVDLRELGMTSDQGELLLDTDPLLHLKVYLQAPWGVHWQGPAADRLQEQGFYELQSGQLNQMDATFWIPSPIGIGALVIGILVTIATQVRAALDKAKIPTQPAPETPAQSSRSTPPQPDGEPSA